MMPVSNDTLLRLVRRRGSPAFGPSRAVGIDDWAWKRNYRYGTLICDLERRRTISLLPDREPATAQAWLAAQPQVEVVTRNRGGAYALAATRALPQAVQASAPARLIEGGLPTEATVAHVIVAKYGDHCPHYRQTQFYARRGVNLDRSTLAHWTGSAAELLNPLHARLLERLKGSGKLFANETRAPVLDPGRGRTKLGQFWAYARDDRPWGGPEPPGAAFVYSGDRAASSPTLHLAGYRGVLQVDGYAADKTLARSSGIKLAFCWSHARRLFYDELDRKAPEKTPIAAEVLARVQQLYTVEAEARGRTADERRAVQREKSAPVLQALKPWLLARLELLSQKSDLAAAIRYVRDHWDGLTRFLDDGRLELDTNMVERAIRPLALTRKNALFAGSQGGAALASLIATCKLNDVEPVGYLTDVLTRLVNGHLQSRLDDLLPWAYAPLPIAAAA